MGRKKNPNNNYFNQEVENAVCAYLSTDDQIEREKHFKLIYPALCKIAEVWYHKVKFSYSDDDMQDVMASCVAWLVEKMPMFKCGQGTKAFSYYTVTARFYYIQLANKNYKYFQKNIPISSLTDKWDVENSDTKDAVTSERAKLFYGFLAYCEHNFDTMFPQKFKVYGRLLLDVLSNFEEMEDFRTRKVLQHIYKMGNIPERKKTFINRTMTIMGSHYTLFQKRWLNGNESLELCKKNFLTEEEKQLVKDNIVPGIKNNGTVAFAKRFGVDVKIITEYLKTI